MPEFSRVFPYFNKQRFKTVYKHVLKYRCIINVFYTDIDHQKKNSSDACHIERQDEKGGPPSPIIKVTSLEDPNDNTVIL